MVDVVSIYEVYKDTNQDKEDKQSRKIKFQCAQLIWYLMKMTKYPVTDSEFLLHCLNVFENNLKFEPVFILGCEYILKCKLFL